MKIITTEVTEERRGFPECSSVSSVVREVGYARQSSKNRNIQ
jgi:hypothetical protein